MLINSPPYTAPALSVTPLTAATIYALSGIVTLLSPVSNFTVVS